MQERPIYWTHFERYQKCPQQFLWHHGWPGVDVGGGPGRRKPIDSKKSEHHLLMGTVTQAVLERFYNDELWKNKGGYLKTLEEMIPLFFERELARRYIQWELSPTKAEMLQVCYDGVMGFVNHTMKAHRLLACYARSEVELIGWIRGKIKVACKADFILSDKKGMITILEGKNSKYKGKYVDKDQIRWAAMCFYLSWRELPTKLGYLYWRYPHGYRADGLSEPEEGVEWVPFTTKDIRSLADRAMKVGYAMRDQKFSATPTPQHCRFCDYEPVCPERDTQRALNAAGRSDKDDDLKVGQGGFVELDLSG